MKWHSSSCTEYKIVSLMMIGLHTVYAWYVLTSGGKIALKYKIQPWAGGTGIWGCSSGSVLGAGVNIVTQGQTGTWASWQIHKIAGCACAGNVWNVFPTAAGERSDMHHGTCVTHVPWCMPGLLTRAFLWSRWRGKCSRHARRMRNPQFCVSSKRPIPGTCTWSFCAAHGELDDNRHRLIVCLCPHFVYCEPLILWSLYVGTDISWSTKSSFE